MSVESVRQYFIENNLDDPVFELDTSGATVDLAAESIGVAPEQIAKTLAFRTKDRDILIVIKGSSRVDNKKYKQFFKAKAKMLGYDEVEEITGHPVGGLCPFGIKNSLDIYLDISIKDYEFVYPAAGSTHTAMKITPEKIQELTNAEWVDVCE